MFSKKTGYNSSENNLSRLLSEKRKSGVKILDLTESNPTQAGFEYNGKAILDAISSGDSLKYCPAPKGIQPARDAIKKYYESAGIEVSADNIFLTSSTSEAYSFVFKLLADPYDEILIPAPGYPLFSFIAELESVNIKYYNLIYTVESGFRINIDSLKSNITEKTKAIVIVNPNNPAGNFLDKNDLNELISVCKSGNIALICDEVFFDYIIEKDKNKTLSLAFVSDILTFTLSGISKICALPQMKLSWIVLNGPEKLLPGAKARLEVISDTFLSVGTPVQLALPALLENRHSIQRQISDRINSNYNFLKNEFSTDKNISVLKTEGGWYSVVNINEPFDEEKSAYQLLDKKNVYIHPGYFFDFEEEGFVIVSLLVKQEDFSEGIKRLKSFLEVLL